MFEAPRQSKSAVIARADFPAASGELDFLKIAAAIWRGRATVLVATAVSLLLAVLFVLIAPHRFTAVTEILIEPTDLRAVANEPSGSTQASDTALLQIDSQVRVLTSDEVLRRVVNAELLDHDPEFVGAASPLRLVENAIFAMLGRGAVAANPSLAALTELRRRVQVKRAERTYVVDVGVSSRDPAKAARLANAVAQAYLTQQTQVRFDAARQVSQSLTARLNDLKERVHQAEEKVVAFRAQHNIVDANGQLVNEQQLSDLNVQLAAVRARLAAAKARLDQITTLQKTGTDVGSFPEAVQSPTITALRSQYAEVMRREAEQMTSLGPRHPAVIEIQAQATRLQRMIEDEVGRIARSARSDYESAKANEELLARNVDLLKQGSITTDAALVTLRELQRDVQASRAVYESFLVRARETGEQERVDTKNIQIISKADLPQNRTSPPPSLLLALGAIIFGIGAGSGLVVLRTALPAAAPRRRDPALPARSRTLRRAVRPEPAASADVPVLAVVPGIDSSFGRGEVDDETSRFAIGIRKVYEAVQAHDRRGNPSILIVASDDGNDTAAVALTLAALAATTQRVLLIDADVERRTLSAIDADQGDAGLVDVAVGRKNLADAVIHDRNTNINLLPFVSPNSRRDRAIDDEDIRDAFAQTRRFDVVIVAANQLKHDPSGRFFAGLVDHIVLVARADRNETRDVAEVVSRLGLDARKVRGAILTGAEAA
jgi:uncharacterized protein involved in exopolysaccharide biosynthesis/Mrp family chromosome partitioning ATPase